MANILIDKRLRSFPLRSETREGGLLLPLLFNVVLKVPARTCRQKKNKSHPNWIARGGGRGVRGVNVYRWHLSFVREKVLVTFHHSVSMFNSTNATNVCLIHLKIVEMANFMLCVF